MGCFVDDFPRKLSQSWRYTEIVFSGYILLRKIFNWYLALATVATMKLGRFAR
jgi:hypothetical protein